MLQILYYYLVIMIVCGIIGGSICAFESIMEGDTFFNMWSNYTHGFISGLSICIYIPFLILFSIFWGCCHAYHESY